MARNPFAFRRWPVVFWTTLTYVALFLPLIVVQEVVPGPDLSAGYASRYGVNMTEAWLDLASLTSAYHPYNSRRNEEVREWLIRRTGEIIARNNATADKVEFFNDLQSNVTLLHGDLRLGTANSTKTVATYMESSNVIWYIRGTDDPEGEWWKEDGSHRGGRVIGKGGVLVNAHFDSVSTGYGATDNGMGVMTAMQLINHFTQPGAQPTKGIVVLFNNGEEDGLNGCKVFSQHPLLPFCHTFLNLEGAGNGGRSFLFRTTDEEVTRAYAGAENPFGNVIGVDFFKAGVVKSQTDFVCLHGVYGQRGLDLSFYKWRAVYHTKRDDIVHTSKASLQHMLSAAVSTITYLSGDTGDTFLGQGPQDGPGGLQNGVGHDGVWFSLFGKGFVLFNLRGMFAWSLAALVASPLILMLVSYILHKKDRYYFFTSKVDTYEQPDYEPVKIGGLKSFIRYPFALIVAGGVTLGSAFLLARINPFIIYSSRYAVWSMMLSLFYFVFWVIMRSADFARPSALHRGYAHIWLFAITWSILVVVTVTEDRFSMASGYVFVWFQLAVFVATLITLLELFALPKKQSWGQHVREDHEAIDRLQAAPREDELIAPSPGERQAQRRGDHGRHGGQDGHHDDDDADDDDGPSERTPLVGGRARGNFRTTFANTYRRSVTRLVKSAGKRAGGKHEPYGDEQLWSGRLPRWTWLLQFLILGPVMIVLCGEVGLTIVESVAQTGVDGSPYLLPYLAAAFFAIFSLLPLTPFLHRIPHHVPLLLLAVLAATLIYNLAAFPFSPENRYKASFQHIINLDTGSSNVTLTGHEEYLRPIIDNLPSAAGKAVDCTHPALRKDLVTCAWDGSAASPRLRGDSPPEIPPGKGFAGLVTINATRTAANKARVEITAVNTKNCVLEYNRPVSRISVVNGTAWDDRFGVYPESGVDTVRLWSRAQNKTWVVDIAWEAQDNNQAGTARHDGEDTMPGMDGYVACQWADANTPGTIPALDEVLQFGPDWATFTKVADGLCEGRTSWFV